MMSHFVIKSTDFVITAANCKKLSHFVIKKPNTLCDKLLLPIVIK